jgi:iron complex transport system ATP-binding protein
VPLTLDNVSFGYEPSRPVLREVSLALAPGALTAVVGPNGAGKSTLLRLMAGVCEPWSGSVRLDGAEVSGIPVRARARRIAYLGQRPEIAFAYTVRQYVALGLYAAGLGGRETTVERTLDRVDLSGRAGDLFAVLSAGQQQRAALARVLAQLEGAPADAALLADEPVAAMDPRHALGTLELLRRLASSGVAVAVVLHDLNLAARFCDEALVLDSGGRVAARGPAGTTLVPSVLDPVFAVRFRALGDAADPRGRALIATAGPAIR